MALLNEQDVTIKSQPIQVIVTNPITIEEAPSINNLVHSSDIQSSYGQSNLTVSVGTIPANNAAEILFVGFGVAIEHKSVMNTFQFPTGDSGSGGPVQDTEIISNIVSKLDYLFVRAELKIAGTTVLTVYDKSNPVFLKIPSAASSRTVSLVITVSENGGNRYMLAGSATYKNIAP